MATHTRALPTAAQLHTLGDDCRALSAAIVTWGDRPISEIGDLTRAIVVFAVMDQACSLERGCRRLAHILTAEAEAER